MNKRFSLLFRSTWRKRMKNIFHYFHVEHAKQNWFTAYVIVSVEVDVTVEKEFFFSGKNAAARKRNDWFVFTFRTKMMKWWKMAVKNDIVMFSFHSIDSFLSVNGNMRREQNVRLWLFFFYSNETMRVTFFSHWLIPSCLRIRSLALDPSVYFCMSNSHARVIKEDSMMEEGCV